MSTLVRDSRAGLGTDQTRLRFSEPPYVETSAFVTEYFAARLIRVVVGRLGDGYRLSAPEIDVVSDGVDLPGAWERFLAEVTPRPDAAWLVFDVGPTRPNEILSGLDAAEDEEWNEPAGGAD